MTGPSGPPGTGADFPHIDTSNALVTVSEDPNNAGDSVTEVKGIGDLPEPILQGSGVLNPSELLRDKGKFFHFLAHQTNDGNDDHVKVQYSTIISALTQGLIEANIEAGIGTTSTYTGSTDGAIVGDFDGNGEVSTSDLLFLLANFGTPTNQINDLYEPTTIGVQAGPNFAPPGTPNGEATVQLGSGSFGSGGAVSATIDQNTDRVEFFSSTDAPMSGFLGKSVKIDPLTIELTTSWLGYHVKVNVKVTLIDSSDSNVVDPFTIQLGEAQDAGAQAGSGHNAVINNTSFTIGSSDNLNIPNETLDLITDGFGNTQIDRIRLEFKLVDVIGNVTVASLEPVNINFYPFG